MSYWHSGFPRYVSVAEKKLKSKKKLKQLMKKNSNIKPVIIRGTKLAGTWWGKAWNANLESYADYSSRLGRGRSYARNGLILDLQIRPGAVSALVQGNSSSPYKIIIKIKSLKKEKWKLIKTACRNKIESLPELWAGKFPEKLSALFTAQEKGLFPSPKEIEFDCNCLDWASMCKHVAAALYGIGARFDDDPALFFKLRNIEIKDLVAEAVKDKTKILLKKAEKKSSRILNHSDMSRLFGVEIEKEGLKPIKRMRAGKRSVVTKR